MLDGLELRVLIRDVIATELAAAKASLGAPVAGPAEQRVRMASDADVVAFAKQVLSLAEDPNIRSAIASGRYPFRLEQGKTVVAPGAAQASSSRIAEGVVTESLLLKLPRGTKTLQVATQVSVTPLARDRARSLGITIERMKP